MLEELDTDYDNCPQACEERKTRNGYCEDCPAGEASDWFKEQVESELAKLGKETPEVLQFGHRSLRATLTVIQNLEQVAGEDAISEEWDVTTERCVQILRWERRKARRIDQWNQKQNANQQNSGKH